MIPETMSKCGTCTGQVEQDEGRRRNAEQYSMHSLPAYEAYTPFRDIECRRSKKHWESSATLKPVAMEGKKTVVVTRYQYISTYNHGVWYNRGRIKKVDIMSWEKAVIKVKDSIAVLAKQYRRKR